MNLDDFDCNDREPKVRPIWTVLLILGINAFVVLTGWGLCHLILKWIEP